MRSYALVLIVCFACFTIQNKCLVFGQDSSDHLDDEAIVESEDKPHQTTESPLPNNSQPDSSALTEQETIVDEFPDGLPRPHSSVDTKLLFIDPSHHGVVPRPSSIVSLDIPVGHPIKIIIAFRHLGLEEASKFDFTLDAVAGAIRYPMDYSYYIQNFTALRLYNSVEPNKEASVYYTFTPATQLTGRQYGLTIRLFYHDADGHRYVSTVMNETVQLVDYEPPAGLTRLVDTEAIFLYMVMGGVFCLLLIGLYHLWQSYAPKRFRASGKFVSSLSVASVGTSSGGSGRSGKASGQSGNSPRLDINRNIISDINNNKNEEMIKASAEAARAKGIDVDWIPRDVLLREAARKSLTRQAKSKAGAASASSDLSD